MDVLNKAVNSVVKDASGNVGLGVTPESDWGSAYSAMQIGSYGTLFSESASTVGRAIVLGHNAKYTSDWKYIRTDEASVHIQGDGQHIFKVAPSGTADSAISWTTAMTIDNAGDVIVGSANTVGSTNGSNMTHKFYGKSNQYTMMIDAQIYSGNYHNMSFHSNGTQTGYIIGSSTSVSYVTNSDYRLKENVTPMSGSIDRLKSLKPSRFNFIADADTTVDGFLAHEAQAVVPECVTGEKDAMMMEDYEVTPAVMDGETVVTEAVMGERSVPDMQGIDQAKLVPLLVGAIQELTARLELLEASS